MTMASAVETKKSHLKRFDDRDVEVINYTATVTGATGSGTSAALDLGSPGAGSNTWAIAVTNSASDTYNCTMLVQTSFNNSTWATAVTFTAFTANTTETIGPNVQLDRYVRLSWTKNTGTMVAENIVVTGILESE